MTGHKSDPPRAVAGEYHNPRPPLAALLRSMLGGRVRNLRFEDAGCSSCGVGARKAPRDGNSGVGRAGRGRRRRRTDPEA
jgi:hypothetical protein